MSRMYVTPSRESVLFIFQQTSWQSQKKSYEVET